MAVETQPKSNTDAVTRGVIPYIQVERAAEAVEFYKRAFGAVERSRAATDDGSRLMNCQLEINGGLPRLDMSVEALRHARSRNVTFVLTSDAHRATELQRVEFAALNAQRAWVDPERIANAWDAERLIAWTGEKKPQVTHSA